MIPEGGGQRPGSLTGENSSNSALHPWPGPEKRFCALRSGRYPPPEWNEVKEPALTLYFPGVRESGQELRKRQALYPFFSGPERGSRDPLDPEGRPDPLRFPRAIYPGPRVERTKNSAAVWPAVKDSTTIPGSLRPGSGW